VHLELWPELRGLDLWHLYKYIGHRLLRWVGGYFLIAAMLFFAVAALLVSGPVIVFAVSGSFLLLFFAAWRAQLGLAMILLNVLLALAGNVVGTWRAFRGERAITWEPPASARKFGIGGKSPNR
jgi:hypothetical protein